MNTDLRAEVRRLRALAFFYDVFLKLVLKGMADVVGERGAVSVLRFAAREYGRSLGRSMRDFARKGMIEGLREVLTRAGTEPEVSEEDGWVVARIRKCPFKRPQETPLLCCITQGLIEGFVGVFSRASVRKEQTMAEGSGECVFRISPS